MMLTGVFFFSIRIHIIMYGNAVILYLFLTYIPYVTLPITVPGRVQLLTEGRFSCTVNWRSQRMNYDYFCDFIDARVLFIIHQKIEHTITYSKRSL